MEERENHQNDYPAVAARRSPIWPIGKADKTPSAPARENDNDKYTPNIRIDRALHVKRNSGRAIAIRSTCYGSTGFSIVQWNQPTISVVPV